MKENKENKKSKKVVIGVVIGIVIVVLIGTIAFLLIKLNESNSSNVSTSSEVGIESVENKKEDNKNKESDNKEKSTSFKQMDATDNTLSDDQKAIAKFFDEDFFHPESYEELVRYADMLKNINISCYAQVNSIESSDSENFEAVCQWASAWDAFAGSEVSLTSPIIIKGKKPEKMVIKGDSLKIRGKLVGAETRKINGKKLYLPIVEIIEINTNTPYWYNESTIRQVAKAVFGNNIKIRRPTDEEITKMVGNYFYEYEDFVWLIEMENQSNLNFKVFDIWQSSPWGLITYNPLFNEGVESDYLNKQLFVTPDLQKYIVFNMSRKDKYVYIDIYDRDLKKLWSKEISKASQVVWDATNENLVFVSDNDLYNINMQTGETVFETYVGKKEDVRIVENGYILLNKDSDDTVMFVDKEGKIKNKFDVSFNEDSGKVEEMSIQKLDKNYVILYTLLDDDEYEFHWSSKYIIIDENGNKIKESD